MLPREHGAWGLVLLPFAAGALLGRLRAGLWPPAVLLLLAGLAIRAPLLELAREVTRRGGDPRRIRTALAWVAGEALLIGVSAVRLWPRLSPGWRVGVLGGGILFTLVAVVVALGNRQRSSLFQTVSAAALALAAPLAVQLALGFVPFWGWALWLVFLLHGACSIHLVHQRLARRVAARNGTHTLVDSRALLVAIVSQLAGGVVLALSEPLWLLAPAFSSAFASAEWRSLKRLDRLREPLTRVGWRLVALSAVHLLITVSSFWTVARAGPG